MTKIVHEYTVLEEMRNENPNSFVDWGAHVNESAPSLDSILRKLTSSDFEGEGGGIDEIWLNSTLDTISHSVSLCRIKADRFCILYMGESWVWATDESYESEPIQIYDPGGVEWLIPSKYMVDYPFAEKAIREFWRDAEIKDLTEWSSFDRTEIDFPVDNRCGDLTCKGCYPSGEK